MAAGDSLELLYEEESMIAMAPFVLSSSIAA
jgi:hypothetical protein